MNTSSESNFQQVYEFIRAYVFHRFGISCREDLVANDHFGDLNGAEIRIDCRLQSQEALFTLLHLFGHAVQWNTQGIIEFDPEVSRLNPEILEKAIDYEKKACGFSMQLLLDAGQEHFRQWLSDYSAADLRHLVHFYKTGERLGADRFWCVGEPLLEPIEIPEFAPRVLKWRWDGIVV